MIDYKFIRNTAKAKRIVSSRLMLTEGEANGINRAVNAQVGITAGLCFEGCCGFWGGTN